MREVLYMNGRTAITYFSAEYYHDATDFLSGTGFKMFIENYLKNLASRDINQFRWLSRGRDLDEMTDNIIKLAKQLMIFDVDEIYDPMVDLYNRSKSLFIVEDAYNYWRSMQRFSVINASSLSPTTSNSFMEADTKYNALILQIYRTCEEKLQGKKNNVYRQLQAGTYACMVVHKCKWKTFPGYSILNGIPFVGQVMLSTPILFHPLTNKREGTFKQVYFNPLDGVKIKKDEWTCMPIKVGTLLAFVYFHRDFTASGVSLANLFEIATEEECLKRKPDIICYFGLQDSRNDYLFYYDEANDVWIGSVSYNDKIEYFGYIKKMILTLHNVKKMQDGCLPIHGSMVNVYFNDSTMKSVIMIGDSGAGKSETIEAIKRISRSQITGKQISKIDVIFDDMGSLHIEDGQVYAHGTEIGAFVRLDDLDKGTAYRDLERSIFFNPETNNARVVSPIVDYNVVCSNHKVDMVLYANNYVDSVGVHRFDEYMDAKEVFVQGKRMALGTTQESGLSATYFANPFGPMQQQEICNEIMDKIFANLYENDVYVGEIYTNLGTGHKERIDDSAKELLELIKDL